MKKLGLIFKETSEKQIINYLKDSDCVFIINYSKLSSPDLSSLRLNLKGSGAKLFVVKNTVARRVLRGTELESLTKTIEGPCGLIFVKEEPVTASRILWDFYKAHEQLKLEGGALKNKIINKADIESLAKIPSKEILRAQVVMSLNSPITKLVIVLNQTLKKFVYCLDQIKQKKTS
ncbi:MAG: 50S ribosomal protein L10 [Candidatus Omnitrophota bacterium]|nr:50S ribosomal protein L10 [Candidatus Omnitrophota bacterium]